jgi:hypothetical protein
MRKAVAESGCDEAERFGDDDATARDLSSAARQEESARHKEIATKPAHRTGNIPNDEQTFL